MINFVKYSLHFILLVLIQVLVLNKIQFSGYVNPYLYILFLITLPMTLPRNLTMLIGFLTGMVIDIFSDSIGMHAAACVLIAFVRPYLLAMDKNTDPHKIEIPNVPTLGKSTFFRYATAMTVIHHTALFTIDTFSLHDPIFLVQRIVYSSTFTMLLIFGIEFFRKK